MSVRLAPHPSPLRSVLHPFPWHDGHALVAAQPVFGSCNRAEIRRIYRAGEDVVVPAGTRLLSEDRIGYWFFVVLDGSVRLTRRRRNVDDLAQGGHFGETAILGFAPQPATATTRDTTRLFLLGRRELVSLAYQIPSLQRGLFPDLEPGGFQTRVRRLRAEGAVAWKSVPRRRWMTPQVRGDALPVSFRARPARPATTISLVAAAFLQSAGDVVRRVTPPPRPPLDRRLVAGVMAVVAACAVAFALRFHPAVALVRGIAPIDVVADLTVDGAPVERPTGRYLMTVVRVKRPNLIGAARAFMLGDRLISVRTEPGTTAHDDYERGRAQFLESQRHEVEVAARHAGLDPAKVHVSFTGRRIVGPSAGLVYALALSDMLEPGDLARGRVIAATGQLESDGTIAPVGFVIAKTGVARRAGAGLFLVPAGEDREAKGHLRVEGVRSFDDAVRLLRQ